MRAPALRFALAGAALFVAVDRRPAPSHPVVATSPAATAPSDDEDALLLDVALTAGLDRTDPLVRARLVNLARFLALAPDGADAATLEREARGLDLVRSDPVIRRHLIDLMHLTAATLPADALPAEAELRAYYGQHLDAYTPPPRLRLTHVYLSRDRRGDRLAADADALAARLHGADRDAARGLGDAFARGAEIGPATQSDLTHVFGPQFAAAVGELPPGRWSAPLASSYGLHLVWVEERLPSAPPPFEAVRGQLLHAWLRERRAEQLAASLSALRGG